MPSDLPFKNIWSFQVAPEKGSAFESVWKERKSTLLETPGFIRFALLRGDAEGLGACASAVILCVSGNRRCKTAAALNVLLMLCCSGEYISESVWASRKDFEAWRDSQRFGAAHGSSEGKVCCACMLLRVLGSSGC